MDAAEKALKKRRVPEARANAEIIMASVLGTGRCETRLYRERLLSLAERRGFLRLTRLRAGRRPLSYVLGSQDFMGLAMETGPGVLAPRPETEEVVAEAVRLMDLRPRPPGRILDIGTGTGCISIALALRYARAKVTATDISAKALAFALRNARRHGVNGRVRFVKEDLFLPARRPKADLVISNPPYIPSPVIARLAPEVRAEPRAALDGGAGGLEAVRAIITSASRILRSGGILVMEIGHGQADRVRKLMTAGGLMEAAVLPDLRGRERIAAGKLP